MNLLELYNSNLQNDRYKPMKLKRFDDITKELHKAQYIRDPQERMEKFRELLKNKSPKHKAYHVPNREQRTYKDVGFKNAKEHEKYVNDNNFIYGQIEWFAYMRFLELENYINDIIKQANEKINKLHDAISFLIDKQFEYHVNVLSEQKADFVFSNEYNDFIFDALQIHINELAKIETQPIQDFSNKLRKKLVWKPKKNILGTLFGLMVNEGIIKGSKTDVARALNSMFGIPESTILDNMSLKNYKAENKIKHDKETIKLTHDFIRYLKHSTRD